MVLKKFLSEKISTIIGVKEPVKGRFGIEIEAEFLENFIVGHGELDPAWAVHQDNSLKCNGREFVFRTPLSLEDSTAKVKGIYEKLLGSKNQFDSMRAGTHIHLNVTDLTVKEMFTTMAAYYILEDLLLEDMGEDRQGNFFCLSGKDAEFTHMSINDALVKKSIQSAKVFSSEDFRYAALNLVSVTKFGSLEFRSLRTPKEPGPILDWLNTIELLSRNSVALFKDPAQLCSNFSAYGEADTVKKLLGPRAAHYLAKEDVTGRIIDGIREIQYWVFNNSWDEV